MLWIIRHSGLQKLINHQVLKTNNKWNLVTRTYKIILDLARVINKFPQTCINTDKNNSATKQNVVQIKAF